MNVATLRKMVDEFDPAGDGSAAKSRELILRLLDLTPTPFDRSQFTPGHITCTGLVMAPDFEAVLSVHHARLNRWLLPGGHVEAGDETSADAARREVIEETQAVLDPAFSPFLAGMDVHGIPGKPSKCEPYHLHHDLIFAFQAGRRDVARSEESHEVAWIEPRQFADFGIPESVASTFQRVLRRLKTGQAG